LLATLYGPTTYQPNHKALTFLMWTNHVFGEASNQ